MLLNFVKRDRFSNQSQYRQRQDLSVLDPTGKSINKETDHYKKIGWNCYNCRLPHQIALCARPKVGQSMFKEMPLHHIRVLVWRIINQPLEIQN